MPRPAASSFRWQPRWARSSGGSSPPPRRRHRSSPFRLGQVVMTRGIASAVERSESFAAGALDTLRRHGAGDWGAECADDAAADDWSLANGERLLSAYTIN